MHNNITFLLYNKYVYTVSPMILLTYPKAVFRFWLNGKRQRLQEYIFGTFLSIINIILTALVDIFSFFFWRETWTLSESCFKKNLNCFRFDLCLFSYCWHQKKTEHSYWNFKWNCHLNEVWLDTYWLERILNAPDTRCQQNCLNAESKHT